MIQNSNFETFPKYNIIIENAFRTNESTRDSIRIRRDVILFSASTSIDDSVYNYN